MLNGIRCSVLCSLLDSWSSSPLPPLTFLSILNKEKRRLIFYAVYITKLDQNLNIDQKKRCIRGFHQNSELQVSSKTDVFEVFAQNGAFELSKLSSFQRPL